jgi:hypothetical protein
MEWARIPPLDCTLSAMNGDDGDPTAGGPPYPFIPGSSGEARAGDEPADAFPPPFHPGSLSPPPEVLTDQVAALASGPATLPSINEFLYHEPQRNVTPAPAIPARTPDEPARSTPPAYVPPLPGFTGRASSAPPARAHDFAVRTPTQQYAAPMQPRAEPRRTPAVAQPAVAQPAVAQPAVAQPAVAQPAVAQPAVAESPTRAGDSWASGEWQSYDWRSAGALAPEERARAAQAWADLDWESETRNRVRERNEAIAAALEGIARRVRTGDLLVHGHPGMTEEAAAAAALAALLARRP